MLTLACNLERSLIGVLKYITCAHADRTTWNNRIYAQAVAAVLSVGRGGGRGGGWMGMPVDCSSVTFFAAVCKFTKGRSSTRFTVNPLTPNPVQISFGHFKSSAPKHVCNPGTAQCVSVCTHTRARATCVHMPSTYVCMHVHTTRMIGTHERVRR